MKKKYFLTILIFSSILINCSKDKDPILSDENKIISFDLSFNGETYIGQINQLSKTINIETIGLELTSSIIPEISISANATISPSLSVGQDFKQEVQYTVTAENGNKAIYRIVVDNTILSDENKINSFDLSFNGETYIGQINQLSKTINIETIGLELTSSIIPEISISANATISPSLSVAQDFKQEVQYTVTAENGNKAIYRIIVDNTILLSNEKKILNYSFEYDNKVYEGIIDHDALTIDVETDFGVIGAAFSITISEGATYTFSPGGYQNFHLPITYTVTAEDGTSNDYVMTPKICQFNPRNLSFYSNANPIIGGFNIDLTVPNSALVLENETHSYILDYSDYSVEPSTAVVGVDGTFRLLFPENIVSASDYKLRYKVNNVIKAEADRNLDILAENIPIITSSNQDVYKRGETMILSGSNLVSSLLVDAYNGSDYVYFPPYLSVNNEQTELTFPMTINPAMFPSYAGISENYPTRVFIYYNGREGDSIIVDFD
tara:strand:- start:694 stop:2178 length:1485 start_codon:yes stop_codon:yes gene_type:complete